MGSPAPDVDFPADPIPRAVIGYQYASATTDPTKVIVLAHGHSGWQTQWDFKPNFSFARNLARAGYLVISYDWLGHGESTYPLDRRETLTLEGQRQMLHEIIEQIRRVSVLRAGDADPCVGMRAPTASAGAKMIVLGRSLGAILVNGYPGDYPKPDPGHVDALIENGNFISEVVGGTRASAIFSERIAVDAGRDFSAFLTDGSFDPYVDWQPKVTHIDPVTCKNNKFFLLWPGATTANAYLDAVCNTATWETDPYNEVIVSPTIDHLENTDADLPVLLTWGQYDQAIPDGGNPIADAPCNPDPTHDVGCRRPFVDSWRQRCPCASHVSRWEQPNAGHAFEWALSMPRFTDEIVAWLASNDLAPAVTPGSRLRLGRNRPQGASHSRSTTRRSRALEWKSTEADLTRFLQRLDPQAAE